MAGRCQGLFRGWGAREPGKPAGAAHNLMAPVELDARGEVIVATNIWNLEGSLARIHSAGMRLVCCLTCLLSAISSA